MLTTTTTQNPSIQRITRWLMVFALIFAAWHVSLHEVDLADGSLNECQVCSLSQTSLLGHANQSAQQVVFIAVATTPMPTAQPATPFYISPWQARAPPLA